MAHVNGVNSGNGVNGINGVNGHGHNVAAFEPSKYPPFPSSLSPVHDLQTISLSKILDEDQEEQSRMLDVCKSRGFFYLDFSKTAAASIVEEAERLGALAQRTFELPMEEKMRFPYQLGTIFGYKKKGATVTDKNDTRDTAEFFNIGKDDVIKSRLAGHYPSTIVDAQPLLETFVRTAHSTGLSLLFALCSQLGLSRDSVAELHRISEAAGDQVRLTYGPPRERSEDEKLEIQTPAHTDFGTITLLFNWLGGLQLWSRSSRGEDEANVLDPDDPDGKWLWLKPKPGHAIVNLGEAAAVFTGGVLCAGRHRVLPSPGDQGRFGRYSIVYFVRPEDAVVMKRLEGEHIPRWKDGQSRGVEGMKVGDWIIRQTMSLGYKEGLKNLD